ncbi:Exopolyphosphatase [Botrimarina colliarenosi]|uniref:Exopolyphosphatase n=1 Tax=Botrimarina colliarenosi TaxID=2528001 RepID=A0A5C6A4C6_9BACT|nr:Ppx/GppA phosphatase family protein [Botrimarina colliarenosi]TWT94792.1 Exopolyphosphatase [Botrimarina colliarenosi]
MSQPETPPAASDTPTNSVGAPVSNDRLAAVDIGSNSVRIVVARAVDTGYQVLDEERENTRLAASLATTGELCPDTMAATIAALRNFVTMAQGYGVASIRAIATSAVRDATNGRAFCDRIQQEVGLKVEVISPREEGRLSFLSVARAFDVSDKPVAVADIGGGSTEIVLAAAGVVEEVYATRLGAVRVAEACGITGVCSGDLLNRAKRHIDEVLRRHARKPPLTPAMLYGAGGTFTALAWMMLAREGVTEDATARGYRVNRADLNHLVADLARMTLEERSKVSGLNPRRADIIMAGLLVIDRILKHFRINEVQVHTGGVRDGLLLTMVEESLVGTHPLTATERRDAVERFAERCGADLPHARHVARLSSRLLEELSEHLEPSLSLRPSDKTLVETAALLANVGYLVNFDGHHKHSYHLIINSDLPGFERDDLRVVANVARYHRGARPKQKHKPFAALGVEDQDRVAKMAAILRVALALDRTHQQQVSDLSVEVTKSTVQIAVSSTGDAEVDLWAARRKVDLFERVFGRQVEFTVAT